MTTYEPCETLVIVFGAGGRLGQALLPALASGPWGVVAVMREKKPPNPPPSVSWIQIDVTQTELWERSLRVFCGMADIHERVTIVDLVLDPTTVTTMRSSLAAGTLYIKRLRTRLSALDRPSSLVLASTTAILAPWLYQTPYGMAKRRQLACYASAATVGRALLLPSLVFSEAEQANTATPTMTYADAASLVVAAIAEATVTEPTCLQLTVPEIDIRSPRTPSRYVPRLGDVFTSHLRLVTSGWDSPAVHRQASHARLTLTPCWLRRHVDHHLAPGQLVRRLARRLETEVEEYVP